MALPSIDLEAMERATRKETDRRLARYLCDTLAPVLPRLPNTPERMPAFVKAAGQDALAAGYDQGRQYSTHITLSLLLGLGWENDLPYAAIHPILTDPGMPQETRLNLALNTAITQRKQSEHIQPQLHGITLKLLAIHPETLQADDIWPAFQQAAALRGVTDSKEIQSLFERYEADVLDRLGIPPIQRRTFTAYELAGIRHMGGRLPRPTDALQALEPHQLLRLGHHLLLALSFGRFFHRNPLFGALHDLLARDPNPRQYLYPLQQFLQQHQDALKEASHG